MITTGSFIYMCCIHKCLLSNLITEVYARDYKVDDRGGWVGWGGYHRSIRFGVEERFEALSGQWVMKKVVRRGIQQEMRLASLEGFII